MMKIDDEVRKAFSSGFITGYFNAHRKIAKMLEYKTAVNRKEIEEEFKNYLDVIHRSNDGQNKKMV